MGTLRDIIEDMGEGWTPRVEPGGLVVLRPTNHEAFQCPRRAYSSKAASPPLPASWLKPAFHWTYRPKSRAERFPERGVGLAREGVWA